MTPSPVDRFPRVGEIWRLPETVTHGPIEARIINVEPGIYVAYHDGQFAGHLSWPVFRASARFLREKPKARN